MSEKIGSHHMLLSVMRWHRSDHFHEVPSHASAANPAQLLPDVSIDAVLLDLTNGCRKSIRCALITVQALRGFLGRFSRNFLLSWFRLVVHWQPDQM